MLTPKTITIGKTTYSVGSVESLDNSVLYSLNLGKQIKSLFYSPSLEMWTLWSGHGMRGLGLPKIVTAVLNY